MELRDLHTQLKKIKLRLLLSSLALFLCTVISAQSTDAKVIRAKDATAGEVLDQVQSKTEFTFNYIEGTLPMGKFSFSLAADDEDFLNKLSDIIGKKIVVIDGKALTISPKDIDEQSVPKTLLEGKLTDGSLDIPIIGATVELPSLGLGTITDVDGTFILDVQAAPSEKVKIQYLGYKTYMTTVANLLVGGNIRLQSKEHVLDDIVIRSTKTIAKSDVNGDYINPQDIDLPSTPDKDAFAIAQLVPGVYNSSESFADMQIRGGPPDQVSYNWNNIRLFQNSLFYGRVSAVNPFMVDQINITRNGASADEDASASGAINMNSQLNRIDTFEMRVHLNALYTNIGVQAAITEKLTVKAAYRKSLTEIWKSPIYNGYFTNAFQFGRLAEVDYFLDSFDIRQYKDIVPNFQFQDASASVQYDLGNKSYVKANVIGYGNEFTYKIYDEFNVNAEEIDSFSTITTGGNIEWQQQMTRSISTNLNYGLSKYDYGYFNSDDKNNEEAGATFTENELHQKNLKASVKWKSSDIDVTLGYDKYIWKSRYEAMSNRIWEQYVNSDILVEATENSYYSNISIHTEPWYQLLLGARWSDYSYTLLDRKFLEPRIHASLFATNNLTLHAHYGKFHQSLNRRKIITPLNVDNSFWLLSDERLGDNDFLFVVTSEQLSFGSKYVLPRWAFAMDVYSKRANDVWSSAFDFTSDEDRYEFANLTVRGLEASVQYRHDWLTLMWTYDYVDDKIYTQRSELLIPSPYNQPHRLSFFQGGKWGRWSVTTQLIYATGRRFSVPLGFRLVQDKEEEYYQVDFDGFFNSKSPDYIKLDASLRYTVPLGKLSEMTLSLQLMNVLGRDNIIKSEFYLDYRQVEPRLRSFDRRGLPRLWNFSMEASF